jgi:hypothetical protein
MAIVEFEHTPNPNALRIRAGRRFTNGPPLEFDRTAIASHPLITGLLAIEGVERVMIARDFVTVVREGAAVPWDGLRPEIALALTDLGDVAPLEGFGSPDAPLGEVEQHIEEVLDRYVRHHDAEAHHRADGDALGAGGEARSVRGRLSGFI